MVITCNGPLIVEQSKNTAVFYNHVVVKDSQGKLCADRMDVLFDPKTNELIKVVASGNVVIIRGENISRSQKAIYLAKEKKLMLEGAPKLEVFTTGDGNKEKLF